MSSKRRKLITGQKSTDRGADPRALFGDGVRSVLQSNVRAAAAAASAFVSASTSGASTGGGSSATRLSPQAAVAEALADQAHIHAPHGTYEHSLRALVADRVAGDADFAADRYPQLAKWMSKK